MINLFDSVERLQRELHALQLQFAAQVTQQLVKVLLLYAGLLILTVLTMRLVVGLCRVISDRKGRA